MCIRDRDMHVSSTGFPQRVRLDDPPRGAYAGRFMNSWKAKGRFGVGIGTIAGVWLSISAPSSAQTVAASTKPGAAAQQPADATLFRVFLKDGATLASYGEIALVGDRVVFSMPTSIGPNPELRLVTIPA